MPKHGTADDEEVRDWKLGQLGEVLAIIARSLKNALEGRDPKSVIEKLGKNGKVLAEGLSKLIGEIMEGVIFLLKFEGSCSASELVKKGKYDWSNDWITDERFPIKKHEPIEHQIELVEFDYDPTSENVLAEFKKRGLDRPIYEDAFHYGIKYPEEQRKHPVVFLHEPVLAPFGRRSVLVLDEYGGKRKLILGSFDGGWDRRCAFAGVRK